MENQIYLDIELKPAPLQPRRQLLISDEHIKWGDKTMNTEDVTAVKYGSIAMGIEGIQTNQQYSFKFHDKNGNDLAIYFSSVSIAGPNRKLEEAFKTIEDAVWNACTVKIIEKWIDDLHNGRTITVGDVALASSVVKMKISGLFTSREATVSWDDIDKELNRGYFYISSKTNRKDKCSFSIQGDWNAITLYFFFNWLWKENRLAELKNKA